MTKILHVLHRKKCSAGHHIPKTAISESELIKGEHQAHLQSWKNSHEETGPTGPSNSLLSQGRQYKEMLHCVTRTPQMRQKFKQLVHIKRKGLRSATCTFGAADTEKEAGQKQSWSYQIRLRHHRN